MRVWSCKAIGQPAAPRRHSGNPYRSIETPEPPESNCWCRMHVVLDLGRRPEARFLGTQGGEYLRDAEVRGCGGVRVEVEWHCARGHGILHNGLCWVLSMRGGGAPGRGVPARRRGGVAQVVAHETVVHCADCPGRL